MKPVFGRPHRGDCLRACLASILEISLDEVPKSLENNLDLLLLNKWLSKRGFGFCLLNRDNVTQQWPGIGNIDTCIGIHTTQRPGINHAVVVKIKTCGGWRDGFEIQLLHDPQVPANPSKQTPDFVQLLVLIPQAMKPRTAPNSFWARFMELADWV